MGVINITPDSFSDGGQFLNPEAILQQLNYFYNDGVSIVDIGAESTAPMNAAIECDEEIDRFKKIFSRQDILQSLSRFKVSIDTYRPETFKVVARELLQLHPDISLIWNDISGIFDEQTMDILQSFPSVNYIYSHNFSPDRTVGSRHMEYVQDVPGESLLDQIVKSFARVMKSKYADRIILDPCFGFSKNYEQNIFLLENFHNLMNNNDNRWRYLIGISRKSFLQKLTGISNKAEAIKESEKYHIQYLQQFIEKSPDIMKIFRIHDSKIINFI